MRWCVRVCVRARACVRACGRACGRACVCACGRDSPFAICSAQCATLCCFFCLHPRPVALCFGLYVLYRLPPPLCRCYLATPRVATLSFPTSCESITLCSSESSGSRPSGASSGPPLASPSRSTAPTPASNRIRSCYTAIHHTQGYKQTACVNVESLVSEKIKAVRTYVRAHTHARTHARRLARRGFTGGHCSCAHPLPCPTLPPVPLLAPLRPRPPRPPRRPPRPPRPPRDAVNGGCVSRWGEGETAWPSSLPPSSSPPRSIPASKPLASLSCLT